MPKRDDIKKILLIGSGPIVIGQACEFDYSGTQACKALREEGFEVVLVNSNPATIMTDPEFADRTYIEPLTVDVLHEIIRRERPDALLPTLGGQTALNLAMDLHDVGILERYRVEMIGAKAEAIRKAEDRNLFKKAMQNINLDLPVSGSAHSLEEAWGFQQQIGRFPVVIRPGFTMGGSGGGIAYDANDFEEIVRRGLDYSPITEVLVEESILGWKEFELEVMRDRNDNVVIICSIENVDPMGVHTGDSITVAPAQTLTDREYQRLRDAAVAVMREVGVDTGGSNVQFSVNPENGRLVIIEMNPRVSRSSALASKATGFPIAKFAAKLAVGYTLDEIQNDITRETPACFEPTIDYVVTKIPRFAFEKFAGADSTLTTQMKSVGEAMSIGKTFKQSFQKALRSLETGRAGFGADGKDDAIEAMPDAELEEELKRPNAVRVFQVRAAFRRGWSLERIHDLTKIDPWFLDHMEELVAYEDEIAGATSLEGLRQDEALFRQAKEFGYSDRQLAHLLETTEADVREARGELNILPVYALVDTCAAEFEAFTPYYYSTYGERDEVRPSDRKKIMILGGGPNRIGQGIEFDYCCVHASFALHEAGFETIMVNSNPETVSTDYDTSDRLYFEPLTLEDVLHIYRRENCWGTIVQFGGQTPLNLALALKQNGVNVIGTAPESIEAAEDREFFKQLVTRLGIQQPENGTVTDVDQAVEVAQRIGYPLLVRPSFVLGGRAMVIVYSDEDLRRYMEEAFKASEDRPILLDRFLEEAVEVDVDCISDGKTSVIGAIMEHVERAGVHSGDSACIIPSVTLSEPVLQTIREHTHALARELQVCGLMNIQYAVKDETVFILEVNPRASRTIPYVSKAIGVPLAKLASLVMAGKTLEELGFTAEVPVRHHAIKEAVLPFVRFPGTDVLLSPEMKSTGEVMGIDVDPGMAYLKSQLAAGNSLPEKGVVFVSVCDADKEAIIPLAARMAELGFDLCSTLGTSTILWNSGTKTKALFRISDGRPNVLDLIKNNEVVWIVNTPSGAKPRADEVRMRADAVLRGIPITTTMSGLQAAIQGLEALRRLKQIDVCSLQEFQRHTEYQMPEA
ncbi:MAG: carbamoyl-phosphate synthase large subunit [Lentisphaerae bacterium]|jgi:carbamoyl-phosphate synthase large subunit|nr:carbamoyl-phosphate synthase large subunit [Lentisphaerota bacterium]MBT5604474.1 carbamoyl-phosphate synthase large subunit [Lentisphaerota bacterium]MBT7060475.1 carbamoyl-phosphate synthase large subunit [Lentisphaerota bacterium]MBT7844382.1 carbamoyl-phosphate synthase large subunit [Lentisphaerota bacterium]